MATGIFASLYVPSQLYVSGDVAQTASNIIAHERLFRLGIAADLFTFIADVALVWALYVLLKPVGPKPCLACGVLALGRVGDSLSGSRQ